MGTNDMNDSKKPKGSINPLLEKFLAVILGLALLTGWVLGIAVLIRFLMFMFGA